MQNCEPAPAAFAKSAALVKPAAFTPALFIRDESGQDLIEYVLVAGLIGVGAVTAMTNLGGKLRNVFNAISNSLASS
jgi:pilus assembly protein Flp/PilA